MFVAAGFAAVASTHVGFEEEQVLVGLQRTQFGDHFGRFPVGDAGIVQTGCEKHRRIGFRGDVVVGAVTADEFKRGFVGDGIAPLGPLAGGERQLLVEHGVQHINEGHMGDDGSKKLRRLIDHGTHQLATSATAAGGDAPFRGVAALNESACGIDEVIKRVRALHELAIEIPLVAEIIAAADVRDGIGETAIDKGESVRIKIGRRGVAVGSVGVKVQRPAAVFLEAFLREDGNGHLHAIARFDHDALGLILAGIVATRDLLDLECLQALLSDVVVVVRGGRDHGLVVDAQCGDGVFGIAAESGGVARLGEGDALGLQRLVVAANLDVVETVDAALGDEEVFEEAEVGQVVPVRAGDERFPFAGLLE